MVLPVQERRPQASHTGFALFRGSRWPPMASFSVLSLPEELPHRDQLSLGRNRDGDAVGQVFGDVRVITLE